MKNNLILMEITGYECPYCGAKTRTLNALRRYNHPNSCPYKDIKKPKPRNWLRKFTKRPAE